jgi:outer membrane protein TolC
MDNKKLILLLVMSFIAQGAITKVKAQESILGEISIPYVEKLIATAKANYPRVKGFDSQINIAKSDLSGVKASWLEPFSFQYVARSNEPAANTVIDLQTADLLTGYQFGVSINPGSLFAKPSQIKRAKEQVKLAEINHSEYMLQIESQVKTRYYTFLQLQRSLSLINNAYKDAQSNYNTIKYKYERAEATFLEFNSASSALNSALQAKLQLEANYLSAKAALEELTVKKLEEIN